MLIQISSTADAGANRLRQVWFNSGVSKTPGAGQKRGDSSTGLGIERPE